MINWGELQQDSEALDALLRAKPELQSEYDGYVAFQQELREAALNEPIPHARLEALLAGIAPQPSPFAKWTRQWAPRLTAAFVLGAAMYAGAAFVNRDPVRMDGSPEISWQTTQEPVQAANFVRKAMNIQAPQVTLAAYGAKLECARIGVEWACYDYSIKGKTFTLTMSRADRFERANPCITCDGVQLYRGKSGYGWRQNEIAYYLRGADLDTLREMAQTVVREIEADPSCN